MTYVDETDNLNDVAGALCNLRYAEARQLMNDLGDSEMENINPLKAKEIIEWFIFWGESYVDYKNDEKKTGTG